MIVKCDINFCGELDGSVLFTFDGSMEELKGFFEKYDYPEIEDYLKEGFKLLRPDFKATIYDSEELFKYEEYI